MATATVYRPERDWKGQTVGELDDYLIGTVTGVVVGGPAPQPVARFPGVVSTEGMIGIPYEQASGITVEQHDRLVIDDELFAITGPRQFTHTNTLTGTPPTHYWMEAESSH
jgi:hypothetical protein